MTSNDRLRSLQRTIPASLAERVSWRESMANLTSIGTGGPATCVLRCASSSDVVTAAGWAADQHVPIYFLGGCTNLLVGDGGVDGIVVLQEARTIELVTQTDSSVTCRVEAGCSWDAFVAWSIEQGGAGAEAMSGIPGTVGAAPIQNIGAYGQNVASIIETVDVFDQTTAEAATLPAAACAFGYRTSVFKQSPDRHVVTTVTMRMDRADSSDAHHPAVWTWLQHHGHDPAHTSPADMREAVLAVRGARSMLLRPEVDPESRGVGSFFINPTVTAAVADHVERVAAALPAEVRLTRNPSGTAVVSAADLLTASGFGCGHVDGTVGISQSYPSALVNRGGATTRDVLRLAGRIQHRVADLFGVELTPEPRRIGDDG